ncbi:MAG: hypothetical protein M1434_00405 [Chloroflexi bacterium]|nr:hypothetical protein [Chloroflexota bacterium]MCL5273196.1 hypothetical protein [Chloroflexota bacterium]
MKHLPVTAHAAVKVLVCGCGGACRRIDMPADRWDYGISGAAAGKMTA